MALLKFTLQHSHNIQTPYISFKQSVFRRLLSTPTFVQPDKYTSNQLPNVAFLPRKRKVHPPIRTYPPPPSARKRFPTPLNDVLASNISTLDPTGARTRLFSRSNPDSPKVGDVLLVMFKSGESFTGVCLNIRRRGVDTGILLRNTLLTTGVEMWVKIYSPLVKMIEVVQRAQKRARRARLYYMRKPKHDRGDVSKLAEAHIRRSREIRLPVGKINQSSSSDSPK